MTTSVNNNKINVKETANNFNQVFSSPFKVFGALDKAGHNKGEYKGNNGLIEAYKILGINNISFDLLEGFGLLTHFVRTAKGVQYFEKAVLATGMHTEYFAGTFDAVKVGRRVVDFVPSEWAKVICAFANQVQTYANIYDRHDNAINKAKAQTAEKARKRAEKRAPKIEEMTAQILAGAPDMTPEKARALAEKLVA